MKRILLIIFLISFVKIYAQTNLPIPTPAQIMWQEAELVTVFHYDLHVFDNEKYVQSENRITPIPDYNIFNPKKLDTDQWVKAAKDMGAKIAILTATHETGFALYQSDVNPYSMKALKFQDGKGDIVRDFIKSCHKYGIKPGLYIGIRWNSFLGVHDFKVQGDSEFSRNRQAYYNDMCEGMVDELSSQYGDLAIIWFDGGAHGPEQGGPDVLPIIERNQPDAIFYHNLERADIRWGGSETGMVPYPSWGTFKYPAWIPHAGEKENFRPIKHGYPDGKYYMPAMSDAPLRGYNGRHEWFWEPDDEGHIYPLENLIEMYKKSVGHNSTLILGITPDSSGLVPQADVKQMQEFGKAIDSLYTHPIAQVSGRGNKILLPLDAPQKISQVVIQESIEKGERIRQFVIRGKVDKKWIDLYEGTSVGHKHIPEFNARTVSAVKVDVLKSIKEPIISKLSLFYY